ncbi:MAG: type I-B CRISPR-associated endonuclease Cas1b [Candidatus Parvarchaeota archaeon]
MKNIFIFSSGELKREANTLCFISNGQKKFIPVSSVSSIYIFGELSINKKLLEFLSMNHIIVNFFNHYGYYMGSYYPREHYSSGLMILRQAEHYLDSPKRLILAKKFLVGGVSNMVMTVKYYDTRIGGLTAHVNKLTDGLKMIESSPSIETLMSVEANLREEYYSCFNEIIDDEFFKFQGRIKRPPKGPLNAMISFGNSLLYVTILGEIYRTHLDPRIGYLHATNFRKFSLNLDISEIFKPIIVDRVIFFLVNRKLISSGNFDEELGGTYLNERGRMAFVKQYEEKLKSTITVDRRKYSYQSAIRLELYKIEKLLIEGKEYEPFISKW